MERDAVQAYRREGIEIMDRPRTVATVPVACQQWLDRRTGLASGSRAWYRSQVNALAARWGSWTLDNVLPDDVEDWLTQMERESTHPRTVKARVDTFEQVTADAFRRGHIASDPCAAAKLDLPTIPDKQYRVVEEGEFVALYEAASERLAAMATVQHGRPPMQLSRSTDLHGEDARNTTPVVDAGPPEWRAPTTGRRRWMNETGEQVEVLAKRSRRDSRTPDMVSWIMQGSSGL
jgi:hypothetical protein